MQTGKYAVYDNWVEWTECSTSCGGGHRKRERDCIKSNFPPKSDPQTQRLISTYGDLTQVPLTKDLTNDYGGSNSLSSAPLDISRNNNKYYYYDIFYINPRTKKEIIELIKKLKIEVNENFENHDK